MFKNFNNRRNFITLAITLISSARVSPMDVMALRILSPYPPGASADFWVRQLEERLRLALPANISVTYAPGGSGLIAARHLKNYSNQSVPIIMLASMSLFSQIPKLDLQSLDYNPNDEFKPIAILWKEPYYLATRSDSEIHSIDDIFKKNITSKNLFNFGTTGTTSAGGIIIDYINIKKNLKLNHIPFKGMSELIFNLQGGHIDIGIFSYQSISKLVESGEFRIIATTSRKRAANHPDIPSLYDLNIIEFDGSVWFGLFSSKNIEERNLKKITDAVKTILEDNEFKRLIIKNGFQPLFITGKPAQNYIQDSNNMWAKIIDK